LPPNQRRSILRVMQLGPLEQRVLDYLWTRKDPASVREVRAGVAPDLAYTTFMTTLDRLYKKGLLERQPDGRAFRYAARSSREAFGASLVRSFLARFFERGQAPTPLLASLVDAVSDHDRELLPELERLVREKDRALRRSRRRP
jgi:BlaI family transcriptional regulator, penicillinase repressor